MAQHAVSIHVPHDGSTESLSDLLDAAFCLRDLAMAASLCVSDCDPTPRVNAACAVSEVNAVATSDFADRLQAALVREGIVRRIG